MKRLVTFLAAAAVCVCSLRGQTMDWLCHPGEYAGIQYIGHNLFKVKNMRGHWGVLDASGRVLVDEKYDSITPFVENRALLLGKKGERLLGIIDTDGEPVRDFSDEPMYVSGYPNYKDGRLAFANREGLYGYLSPSGAVVIEPQFTLAAPFQDGVAAVAFRDGDFGLINKTGGSMIVSNEYYSFISSPVEGKVFVVRGSMKGGNQLALMQIEGPSLKKKKVYENGMNIRLADDLTAIECQLGHVYYLDKQMRVAGASYAASLPPVAEDAPGFVAESSRVLGKAATEDGMMITYLGHPIMDFSFPDVATYDRTYAVVRSKDGKVGVLKLNPTADISIKAPSGPVILRHREGVDVEMDVELVDVDQSKIKCYRNDRGWLTLCSLEEANGGWKLRMPYFRESKAYGRDSTETVDIAITYDGLDWMHQEVEVKSQHQPGYEVRLRGPSTTDGSGTARLTLEVTAPEGSETTQGTVTVNGGKPMAFSGRESSFPIVERVAEGSSATFRYKVSVREEGCPEYTTEVSATVKRAAAAPAKKTKKEIIIK